jgi:DNA-binding beta-propeller fold protein YncE
VAPTSSISGVGTGLNGPSGVALDSTGKIYVANSGGTSITIYAASASGNATPAAPISGAATLIGDLHGVDVQ